MTRLSAIGGGRRGQLLASLTLLAAYIAVAPFGASALAKALVLPVHVHVAQTALVGTYGTAQSLDDVAYSGGSPVVYIHERGGSLYVTGAGFDDNRLIRQANGFAIDGDGERRHLTVVSYHRAITAISIGGRNYPALDFGMQVQEQVRSGVRKDIDAIRARALAMHPPMEMPAERQEELVELRQVVPGIHLDIRYAKNTNFLGLPVYEQSAAFLQRPAAEALARVAERLKSSGYGLLIHDGYRPWYVTRIFWDATPAISHDFVADPSVGSRHNRGCAVDLTLYRLSDGMPVTMPSRYDEMSPRAFADFPGGGSQQRMLRDMLRHAMTQEGFTVYPQEWWHFDHKDWQKYGMLNVSFADLLRMKRNHNRKYLKNR